MVPVLNCYFEKEILFLKSNTGRFLSVPICVVFGQTFLIQYRRNLTGCGSQTVVVLLSCLYKYQYLSTLSMVLGAKPHNFVETGRICG
jgi:hypothetical protein